MFHSHNNLKRKILFGIVILGILLAPISPIFQKNNDGNLVAGVGVNEARATTTARSFGIPSITINNENATQFQATIEITVATGVDLATAYGNLAGGGTDPSKGVYIVFSQINPADNTPVDPQKQQQFTLNDINQSLDVNMSDNKFTITSPPGLLQPSTTYGTYVVLQNGKWSTIWDGISNSSMWTLVKNYLNPYNAA
jgi:hypothetical protein